MIVKPKAPCMGCEDRAVGCHSTCEKYLSYKEQWQCYADVNAKGRDDELLTFTRRSKYIQDNIDKSRRKKK